MKKAAVICAPGLGDGLLMMVAAHRLYTEGYSVTTFSNHLGELQLWFPGHVFASHPALEDLEQQLAGFDLIVFQNYHSSRSEKIFEIYRTGKLQTLSVFYPSYLPARHPPLTSWDIVFDPRIPMTDNIAIGISTLLGLKNTSKNNGLVAPSHLVHRKHEKRIAIHPTSTTSERTWSLLKFLKVAQKLKEKGFEPFFCLSPKEREEWVSIAPDAIPFFNSLHDLAEFLYESAFFIGNESGPGHLASNLYIPTLIVGGHIKRLKQWRPGWLQGKVLTPSSWILNCKGCRFRENHWKKLISVRKVLSSFSSFK